MIKQVTMYSVICDRCGKAFIDEFNGIVAWLDEGTAKEQAMESEWQEIGDKHYCPNCYEFDDELDEYVPKKKGGDEWRTSRKLIEPIKLTPQILEDNGWVKGELKKEDNARAYYYTYSKKGCIVELRYYPSCDMFLVYIDQEALMDTLFLYVHQLQHLLFGLGLNSEMEV